MADPYAPSHAGRLTVPGPEAFSGPQTAPDDQTPQPPPEAENGPETLPEAPETPEYRDDEVPTAAADVLAWLEPVPDLEDDDAEAVLRARAEAARRVEDARPESDRRTTVEARIAEIIGSSAVSANADRLREGLRRRVEDTFLTALDRTGVEMQVAAPYASGQTVDSLDVELLDAGPEHYSARFAFTAPQALFTDEGTDPHPIDGNPWLVFEIDGVRIFWNSELLGPVSHPGTARTGWFSDNIGPTFLAALGRSFGDA